MRGGAVCGTGAAECVEEAGDVLHPAVHRGLQGPGAQECDLAHAALESADLVACVS